MAITIAGLYADSDRNYNIKLVAGETGLNKPVRWVHMIEDSDVPGFLHGNELIFTTGIAHRGTGWLLDFIASLRKNCAAALVINFGPYVDSIPEEVLEYCDKNAFPLFTIPWTIHLIDVIYDFCHKIITSEQHDIDVVSAFRNIIFSKADVSVQYNVLERRGFVSGSNYAVVMMKIYSGDGVASAEYLNEIKRRLKYSDFKSDKKTCMFVQQKYFVIICSAMSEEEIVSYINELKRILLGEGENTRIYTGISDETIGYGELASCYKQAVTACETAAILKKRIEKFCDTGIYKLLYFIDNIELLRQYCDEKLRDIEFYDKAHNTDYLLTLKNYIYLNGSINAVANEMNVHRNTVNYKIKFLKEKFNMKLDLREITEICVALNIKEILNNNDGGSKNERNFG